MEISFKLPLTDTHFEKQVDTGSSELGKLKKKEIEQLVTASGAQLDHLQEQIDKLNNIITPLEDKKRNVLEERNLKLLRSERERLEKEIANIDVLCLRRHSLGRYATALYYPTGSREDNGSGANVCSVSGKYFVLS